jgi:dTDP-4-amino-4,6-dideoxygalactose transaminase
MAVPLLDLAAQYASIQSEVEAAVLAVLREQAFILGPRVERFERAMASYLGVRHAVGVSSGTDALLISLLAENVGPGDEVITTPFSFFATAGAIARAGARPVFVDIEADSFNLDPVRVEAALTPRTRAILPVHLFGRMAELRAVVPLARERGISIIEDAAQAIGAKCEAGAAGTVGDYGCFSFFPSKNLGGAGDGGLVTCESDERAARLRRLRAHGAPRPHDHQELGGNFRLDALQAAVLDVKLGHLTKWTLGRRKNAERYRRLFTDAGLCSTARAASPSDTYPLVLPEDTPGHVYNQFVVRAARRDELLRFLTEARIGSAVYYPRPLHLQPALAELGYREGDFAVSERAASEVLALPVFPELSDEQAEEVVHRVASFYAAR